MVTFSLEKTKIVACSRSLKVNYLTECFVSSVFILLRDLDILYICVGFLGSYNPKSFIIFYKLPFHLE